MIAKILPRRGSDFNGVVNYSERKTDKGSGELIYSQGFISEDRKSVIDMLAYVSRQNLNVKNPIFHASISFPASENPEKEMLIKIANDYMTGMGYGTQPFIVYQHNDTGHRHVHIVSSRVDLETGNKISDTFEKVRSMAVSNQIEQKYNLQKIERYKGKGYNNRMEGVGGQLNEKLIELFSRHIPKTLKEIDALLGDSITVNPINVVDKETGRKSIKGVMFNVKTTDEQGNDNEVVVPSSYIPCLKQKSLGKRLSDGRKIASFHKESVRQIIYMALRQSEGSADVFFNELKKQNIDVIFHENSSGIFGWSFVFKTQDGREIKYKASEIDRNLAWSNIKLDVDWSNIKLDVDTFAPDTTRTFKFAMGFYGQQIGEDDQKKKRRKKRRLDS